MIGRSYLGQLEQIKSFLMYIFSLFMINFVFFYRIPTLFCDKPSFDDMVNRYVTMSIFFVNNYSNI